MRGAFRMRAIGIVLLIPWMAAAQAAYPPGPPENGALVRGVLLECDARPAGGLRIRGAGNRARPSQFDSKTDVEREERLIEPGRLAPGEMVEVLSDAVAGY